LFVALHGDRDRTGGIYTISAGQSRVEASEREREREREREEQEEEGPLSRPDERHPTSEPQIAPLSTKREMNFRTSKHKSVYPLRVVIVNKKVVESRRCFAVVLAVVLFRRRGIVICL
jgi:hypothetical protein